MGDYFLLFISIALVNNFVLAKFLGLCPFIGVSKRPRLPSGWAGPLSS